jgi:ABC-type sugar transport system ATPase subunit
VSSLSIAERQEVEILKAVARNAKFIVLDEPTSSLTPREVERLHRMISRLRAEQKTTIVYVSHFLHHVLSVCDTISVLRNGAHVRTASAADETEASIVTAMLGRDMAELFPAKKSVQPASPTTLRLKGLTRRGAFENVTLEVGVGEIVGLTGLVGSGRSEVVRAVFGADPVDAGEIELEGTALRLQQPGDAMRMGIAMVPESRRDEGLMMGRSILENLALNNFANDRPLGWIRRSREKRAVASLIGQLNIKCRSMASPVWQLSGGNQQKVLFAKWIAGEPRVLILDEPTRGVDVGAKAEIYRLVTSLAAKGMSILIVSSEIEEVVGLCHRVHVMRQGRLVALFKDDQVQIGPILSASLGTQGRHDNGAPDGGARDGI